MCINFHVFTKNWIRKDFSDSWGRHIRSKLNFLHKFPSRIFHKCAKISTYSPKIKSKKFCPTPGDYTFVQNSISYQIFLAKFISKMQRFRLIYQKLNSKDFFRPLVVLHLVKIEFPKNNFLAKFFIKMHGFRLIYQKLDSNGFFRPLIDTHLFKIEFPKINSVA